ncbi:MAG: UTP--glucose-1-phosphate uridylyltransferase [Chloroflexi bacterium]|nr:MAG: UTP--glucose-1-phosphate uridylyltransferase [Chloroflexota bacterium]
MAIIAPTPPATRAPEQRRLKSTRAQESPITLFVAKMHQKGLPQAAIDAFCHSYRQLLEGAKGYLAEEQIQPVATLPPVNQLEDYAAEGKQALARTVMIKLNGGLGATMGMQGPKSLIEVKDGLTFLDIIVRQVLHLRRTHQVGLPLMLMNSFNTTRQTKAALAAYPSLHQQATPLEFLQHQIPKIWQADLSPVVWPVDPNKEWCPPGHGDLYQALYTTQTLHQLLEHGYEYAFVSNADNLGATVDLNLLGYFSHERLPFLMEVARRRATDRKGGHLARYTDGRLALREVAQCPPEALDHFQDIRRYRYFNTNNLWLHLPTLHDLLVERQGQLALPLMVNEKPVDPAQPNSPRVYQLETAMGHAISRFPDAQAVEVERRRFLPVKNTNDLLALWSDLYLLNDDFTLSSNPARRHDEEVVVDLDKRYYGLFHQLKARFPHHVPSLVDCRQFLVRGNIYFDSQLLLEGDVAIRHRGDEALRWVPAPFAGNAPVHEV